ncbi:MAG TPA: MMPL family transporter [Planctomycetaceae bacterium]|nr:MMPL family transporter [Planctomycetaceae bacterium]
MTFQFHSAWRRFAAFLVEHPRLVMGLMAASVGAALVFVPFLQFDFTPQAIYRGDDELVGFSEEFKRTFGYDEAVVLVVLEARGAEDVLNAGALQWQKDIACQLAAIPRVRSVDSLATLQVPRLTMSGLRLASLVPGRVDEVSAEKARELLDGRPLVRSGLLSQDDRVAAIPVFLDPEARDIKGMRRTVAAVRQTLADCPPPEGHRVRLTGLPVLRVDVVHDLRADQLTLVPLAGLVYLAVLALMFRRLSGAILPLAAVGIGLTWTLATLAATHETVNLVTNVLPVLLLIIGVSSSVQIISCYAEEAALGSRDRRSAALAAIVKMTPACLLAALTTAVGFASLATAHSVLLRNFGWQAAIGVGYQYVCTLIALGAALRFFRPPRASAWNDARTDLASRTASAAGFAVARHPWLTIAGALLVSLGALWAGSGVRINSFSTIETFPEKHPSVQTLRFVERKLAGVMPLEISLKADAPGRFIEPDVFHRVLEVEQTARELPGVLAANSYADLFREVLAHWPGRRVSESDHELVPDGKAGLTRLARTERFVERFAAAFHYDSFVAPDGKLARIRLRLAEIGSQQTLDVTHQLEDCLAKAFPRGGPIEARLTGEAYVNARALTTLIGDLFFSLITASLVIFGLIAIEFRSLRTGLIAALPNLTPLLATLGYMGLRGYDMNVANVIVFTICLGLADDNTIHFLYRFREEMHIDGDVKKSIGRAFRGTGRAIVATSFLLFAGMAVLLVSNFVPTQRFAELTCVTIAGNLLGVLLLLPACLVVGWKPKMSSSRAAS